MTNDIDEELRISLRFPKDLSKYLRQDFEFFKYQTWIDYFKDNIRMVRDIQKVFPDIRISPYDSLSYDFLPCPYRNRRFIKGEFQGFICRCRTKDLVIRIEPFELLTPETCTTCKDIAQTKKLLEGKTKIQKEKVIDNFLIKSVKRDDHQLQSYEFLKTTFKKYQSKPIPKDFIDYISNIKKGIRKGRTSTLKRLELHEILKILELAWITHEALARIGRAYGMSVMTLHRILKELEPFKEKVIEYFMSMRLNYSE